MKIKLTVAIAVVMLALAVQAGEQPWFDMENCAFCKHLMDDPGLLGHSTWENHKTSNGMMSVTTVEPEYLASFEKAMAAMEEAGKRMQAGEQLHMCGMCSAMGELMAKGAKWESVETKHGAVQLMTATDPELVKEIHDFVDHTNEEFAKMEAETEMGDQE